MKIPTFLNGGMHGAVALLLLISTLVTLCTAARKNRNVDLKKLTEEIAGLRHTVANLAKQTMSQQLFNEERIRSSGSSGIKVTRTRILGNSNVYTTSHISGGVAAIHDHANHKYTVGMGETVVVLNGVEFRTRHNDYRTVMPSTIDKTYGSTEIIDTPDVPPEVLAQPTVEDQINEMRLWFKAFKAQNETIRPYKKYFKPIMCYLEGAWTLDKELNEPFESDRHELVASTWAELQQQIRYTSFTGTKDLNENFSFLPTAITGVDPTTGQPIYAQWNYRILCHPISQDIPTKYFRQQDDLAYRESTGRTMEKMLPSRAARFRLSEFNTEKFTGTNSLLDQIMKEIPGKDNVPDLLNEIPFGVPVYDTRYANFTPLNTGYYHRSFKTNKRGAMGLMNIYRGFNDEFLFVAETTQPNIATESFKYCKNKRRCTTRSTAFTWAIPLEIIYLTPLTKWNPYNFPIWDKDTAMADKRRGGMSRENAFNGTSPSAVYYLTPTEFYLGGKYDAEDPADTSKFGVGVLDRKGNVHRMAGSGTRTLTLPIPGAGKVRLRYPIHPIHGEGSSVWKELSVLKKKLVKGDNSSGGKTSTYLIETAATSVSGLHKHNFYLSESMWARLQNGDVIPVTTSLANGHNHEMEIWLNPKGKRLEYKECDGSNYCWDKHRKQLTIKEQPE